MMRNSLFREPKNEGDEIIKLIHPSNIVDGVLEILYDKIIITIYRLVYIYVLGT